MSQSHGGSQYSQKLHLEGSKHARSVLHLGLQALVHLLQSTDPLNVELLRLVSLQCSNQSSDVSPGTVYLTTT